MENQINNYTEETIDFRAILFKVLNKWYWVALSLAVALTAAYIFNKLSLPVYKINTSVLIKDDKNKSINPADFMESFGMFGDKKNLKNEIGILQSYYLINRAITRLELEVSYYQNKKFVQRELYNDSPFIVEYDSVSPQPIGVRFSINFVSKNEYTIEAKCKRFDLFDYTKRRVVLESETGFTFKGKYHFGELIKTPYCKFKILPSGRPMFGDEFDSEYAIEFNNTNALTLDFQDKIQIAPSDKESSFVILSLEGTNVNKVADVLNSLTKVYLDRNIEHKNMVAVNTINFIDSQLDGITDSLKRAENLLQDFRSTNKIIDITYQSQKVFDNLQDLEKEKVTMAMKAKYYDYLEEYFNKNKNLTDLVTPSAIGIEDALLGDLISQLVKLASERNSIVLKNKSKNPLLNSIDININNLKENIRENIRNTVANSKIVTKDIDRRIGEMTGFINKMPKTERELLGIERKFKLSNDIYTFLLQKRAESQIAKASNIPDNEIIDKARLTEHKPISPKKGVNYAIAFILGLALPIGIIVLLHSVHNVIEEKSDIEKLASDIPFLGSVLHHDKESKTVVMDYPKSRFTESLRTIRTNLQYFIKNSDKQTILITSSFSGEGKSFVSINLASVYALMGKKTILIGFDLRKPKVFEGLADMHEIGTSTCLIGKTTVEEVIQKTKLSTLDVITSGPVPPNPIELIESETTKEILDKLKTMYDIIIIDTPPIGIVSDAFVLMEHADVNIYIARQDITNKKLFSSLIHEVKQKKPKELCILLNGVTLSASSYGYSYGKYGYKYYNQQNDYYDEKKTDRKLVSSWLKNVTFRS